MDKKLFIKRREKQQKISFFISVIIIFSTIYLFFDLKNIIAWSLIFGVIAGISMQKSKICFTAAFRDPVLFGMTGLSRAIVLSLILTSIGFAVIQFFQLKSGAALGGKLLIPGLYIPIGAFIFGLGASVSGGCASGTLFRLGEGYQMQYFVVIGFLLGSFLGRLNQSFWHSLTFARSIIHFPTQFGWFWGVFIQLLILIIIYFFLFKWENRSFSTSDSKLIDLFSKDNFNDFIDNFKALIFNPFKKLQEGIWPYWLGLLILGIANITYFNFTGRYWRVSSGYTNLSFWLVSLFGVEFNNINIDVISPIDDPIFWSNIGIIIGALISILAAGQLKFKKIKNKSQIILGIVGGFLMGYGSRVASGCNIGGFYSAVSSLALNGWIYLPFVILGIYLGSKFLAKYYAN